MKRSLGLSEWVIVVSLVFAYLVTPSSVFADYFIGLGTLPDAVYHCSVAFGVSANGSVVVGYGTPDSVTGQLREAFRWDATNGMVGLGFLPGGN